MQRSLSGILFLVAAILIGIAAGLWWMNFTALSPNSTTGNSQAILSDDEIRAEITTVVAAATAGELDQTPAEVALLVDQVLRSRPGAAVAAEITRAGHERLLGLSAEPVRISGPQLVELVRDQRVGDLPGVTLPVAEVPMLGFIERWLGWLLIVLVSLAVIAFVGGLVVRPERIDITRGLAELLISLGVNLVLFGFLLPYLILPAVDDTTWIGAISRLAARTFLLEFLVAIVLIVGGVMVWMRTQGGDRRSNWSPSGGAVRFGATERRWS